MVTFAMRFGLFLSLVVSANAQIAGRWEFLVSGSGNVVVVDRTEGIWTGRRSKQVQTSSSRENSQTPASPGEQPRSAAASSRSYEPPTKGQHFRSYLFDSYGLTALVRAGIRAGILQARDQPSEWGQGSQGFAERFGSVMGEEAISGATRYLLSSAFGEDDRYFRCQGCSFSQKIGNAFVSEFTARRGQDGHRTFSVPQVVSPFAGPLVARNTWYPGSYSGANALQEVGFSFGSRFVMNVIRELLR
jgi:hypothetical protein